MIDSTYHIFRRDRDCISNEKQRGVGIFIATKKVIQADVLTVSHQDVEQVFIKIKLKHEDLIIGTAYIPPNSEQEVCEKRLQDVTYMSNKYPGCEMLLLGDYILPDVK